MSNWICEDCKFRNENDDCICPETYKGFETLTPEHGVFIRCLKSYTECDDKEAKK